MIGLEEYRDVLSYYGAYSSCCIVFPRAFWQPGARVATTTQRYVHVRCRALLVIIYAQVPCVYAWQLATKMFSLDNLHRPPVKQET